MTVKKKVERASEKDAVLCNIRHYIKSGDWSQCKMPHYLNHLCVLGRLVMHGTTTGILQRLRGEVLRLAREGHQGIWKMKKRLRSKLWWPE